MAIICKWRPFSLRASGELAVFCAAVSTSKTFPSAPKVPFGVMLKFGSRLKLSMTLLPMPSRWSDDSP
jgi:hypothetical protein